MPFDEVGTGLDTDCRPKLILDRIGIVDQVGIVDQGVKAVEKIRPRGQRVDS